MSENETKRDVWMPVYIGDWFKGTIGMSAQTRGVYINLLLYQYDNGFIPDDLKLLKEIDKEIKKVWPILCKKFVEISPGKLQNLKAEKVREHFEKQRANGKKGGRPPETDNPNRNPNNNQFNNPKGNPHMKVKMNPEDEVEVENEIAIEDEIENQKKIESKLLKRYDAWTTELLSGNDEEFNKLFVAADLAPGPNVAHLIQDHLDLLNRYPNMRPPNRTAFCKSCIKHLRENFSKPISNGKGRKTKSDERKATIIANAKHHGAKFN